MNYICVLFRMDLHRLNIYLFSIKLPLNILSSFF